MFHDIFSKKKEKKKHEERIKILADFREKNSMVPSRLEGMGFDVRFINLEVGDYLVNGTLVERKSFSDLQSSIINKRIFSQIKNMREQSSSLLIVETSGETFLHENAIRGFFLSLVTESKIPFIFSIDEDETAKFISILASKKKRDNSIRPSRMVETREERIQYILEGFPHIGPKKAKFLLEKFGSLEKIFNAKEEELKEILGKGTQEFKTLLK